MTREVQRHAQVGENDVHVVAEHVAVGHVDRIAGKGLILERGGGKELVNGAIFVGAVGSVGFSFAFLLNLEAERAYLFDRVNGPFPLFQNCGSGGNQYANVSFLYGLV